MVVRAVVVAFAFGCVAMAQDITDLLPDMIVNIERLEDNEVREDIKPGKAHLLLSNGTANIGEGPLEIAGVKPKEKDHDEVLQKVKQRIYRSDGSHYSLPAGFYVYHPSHNHTHFEDW